MECRHLSDNEKYRLQMKSARFRRQPQLRLSSFRYVTPPFVANKNACNILLLYVVANLIGFPESE